MKTIPMLAAIAMSLASSSPKVTAAEAYVEPYQETKNPARIFDWQTLRLLISTRLETVKIDADSPEKLISQLEKALHGIKSAEGLRFSFKRELWEQPLSDSATGKINIRVKLQLEREDLLSLIQYVSELNAMTFSVKKGEIVFRPLVG
jgi:hypothetical protein